MEDPFKIKVLIDTDSELVPSDHIAMRHMRKWVQAWRDDPGGDPYVKVRTGAMLTCMQTLHFLKEVEITGIYYRGKVIQVDEQGFLMETLYVFNEGLQLCKNLVIMRGAGG